MELSELKEQLDGFGISYSDPRIVEVLAEAISPNQYIGLDVDDIEEHLGGHALEMLYAELPAAITENRIALALEQILESNPSLPMEGNGIFILFFSDENPITMEEMDVLQPFIDENFPADFSIVWCACMRSKPELAIALVYGE